MKKESTPASKSDTPALALEKTAKGSHRSMWEILLQLRALLPYLARIVPLLERLLDRANSKPQPFEEVSQSITAIQAGSRSLELQTKNQALQLERIEQQLAVLRSTLENNAQQSRTWATEIAASNRRLTTLAYSIVILLLGLAAMTAYLLLHTP